MTVTGAEHSSAAAEDIEQCMHEQLGTASCFALLQRRRQFASYAAKQGSGGRGGGHAAARPAQVKSYYFPPKAPVMEHEGCGTRGQAGPGRVTNTQSCACSALHPCRFRMRKVHTHTYKEDVASPGPSPSKPNGYGFGNQEAARAAHMMEEERQPEEEAGTPGIVPASRSSNSTGVEGKGWLRRQRCCLLPNAHPCTSHAAACRSVRRSACG